MVRHLRYPVLLVAFVMTMVTAHAQLATGDIAFTGYNSSPTPGNDDFSFVVTRVGGIAAGTQIKFTNRGFQSGTCAAPVWSSTPEEEITFTVPAGGTLQYGRQIRIVGLSSFYNGSAYGTVTGSALDLSAGGDQIIAYQGTQAAPTVVIAGIHMNGPATAANWDNLPTVTGTQSNKPPCLTNGTHALFVDPEADNARLRSIVLTGNRATDLANINNENNWDSQDGTAYTLPAGLAGLPVDFTSIKALQKGANVEVEWGVGEEDNVQNYIIERSADGRLFTEAGSVVAIGKHSYSWTDIKPLDGNNFYRIRAVDLDLTFKFSTIAIVNLSKAGKGINVYPTIVRDRQFNLQITNMPAGNYRLDMFNATGQRVFTRNVSHLGGSATQSVNVPAGLPKGTYRIRMLTDSDNTTSTIIIE